MMSLARVLQYAGTHRVEDIELGIAEGRFQQWPGEESCIVTELLVTPLRKTIHFFLAEGNLLELRAMTPGILAWGRSQGCTHAAFLGREGWERSFVREFGFLKAGTLMEASLEGR